MHAFRIERLLNMNRYHFTIVCHSELILKTRERRQASTRESLLRPYRKRLEGICSCASATNEQYGSVFQDRLRCSASVGFHQCPIRGNPVQIRLPWDWPHGFHVRNCLACCRVPQHCFIKAYSCGNRAGDFFFWLERGVAFMWTHLHWASTNVLLHCVSFHFKLW